jgi:hypothetical protein
MNFVGKKHSCYDQNFENNVLRAGLPDRQTALNHNFMGFAGYHCRWVFALLAGNRSSSIAGSESFIDDTQKNNDLEWLLSGR